MNIITKLQEKKIKRRLGLNGTTVKCFVRVPDRVMAHNHFRYQIGDFTPDKLSFIASASHGVNVEFKSLGEFEKHLILVYK